MNGLIFEFTPVTKTNLIELLWKIICRTSMTQQVEDVAVAKKISIRNYIYLTTAHDKILVRQEKLYKEVIFFLFL